MKWRLPAGLLLMLASLPCFGLGAVVIMKTMDQAERAERQAAATDKQCRERLATLGQVKDSHGTLEVTVRNVTDPRAALSDASLAQSLCPQRTLASMCLGEACDPSAKSVTLRFQLRQGKD